MDGLVRQIVYLPLRVFNGFHAPQDHISTQFGTLFKTSIRVCDTHRTIGHFQAESTGYLISQFNYPVHIRYVVINIILYILTRILTHRIYPRIYELVVQFVTEI
jgi:hypothetical protein